MQINNGHFTQVMTHQKCIYVLIQTVLFVAATISFDSVYAQSHNEKVTIEGAFKPSIQQFNKVYLKPETPEEVIQPIQTDIVTLNRPVHAKAELETLSPISPRSYETNAGYQNFLMAGMGSRLSPLFLFEHNSNLSDETAIGVSIRHASTWLDIKDYAPADYMNNDFGLKMTNKIGMHQLKSSISYVYDTYRYYGFKPADYPAISVAKKDLLQSYQTIGFNTQLNSTETDLGYINHKISLDYAYFFDRFDHHQHEVDLKANLRRDHDWFSFEGRQSIGLDISTKAYLNQDSIQSSNHFLVETAPYLQLNGSFYQLKLGLRFNYHNGSSPNIWVYPQMKGSLFVFEKKLEFYAGTDGGIQRLSYHDITQLNPYVNTIIPERWQNTRFLFEAGIRSSAVQSLDIHVGIRYRDIDQAGYLITDSTALLQNKFTVVYDKTKQFDFLAEAAWHRASQFGFNTSIKYHVYQTDSITKAWHKPTFEMSFDAFYTLSQQLKIHGGLSYRGKMYAPTYLNGSEFEHIIDGWTDLHAGADYRISDQFSVYAQFNNLLNTKYQLFYQYPVHGLQLFAGIKVRF